MCNAGGYDEYEFVAEFYDHLTAYRDRPDVSFFVEAAVESKGSVLEVACGTGRVLIPTARRGVRITGIDLSEQMLKVCRQRLQSEPPDVREKVRLMKADMRQFELGERFSLGTVPFRPFQHLTTVEDQCSCLGTIRSHLAARARLILDVFNPWLGAIAADNVGQELGPEPEFTMPDGRRVVRYHKFASKDLFSQINHMEMIYYVTYTNGRKERLVHAFPMRYLFRFEAEHLLVRCGYRLLNVYADYQKNPYGSTYPGDLVMVAERA